MALDDVRSKAVVLLVLIRCELLLHCGILSLFYFCCALLCFPSSFAIILMGKREMLLFFALFVFLVPRNSYVTLPHDATGFSAVCDCGIS